jgi:uncharacterized coiled-coil DUF342 family protein
MLQLMRQLSEARTTHNAQVLTLRQRKRELVARLNSLSARLAEVNKLLGITGGAVLGQFACELE